ncbi:MAG: metalloregulator ArsR/SmtB family transcription factor [Gemmatimonadales bacterium]
MLFKHFARVAQAISHAARIEILDLLAQGEKSVDAVARGSRLTLKNASAHLRILREAALVATRRDGTRIYYRLAEPEVHAVLRAVQGLAERRLAEVREIVRDYFAADGQLEPVTMEELQARLAADDVTLLDVRPPDEYAQGHIPGAISVPLSDLPRHLDTLPRDRQVVAYCRGAYCVLAVEAAALLARTGFTVRRLAHGMPDWAARGFPVERQS